LSTRERYYDVVTRAPTMGNDFANIDSKR
jgi:hypothetical protein